MKTMNFNRAKGKYNIDKIKFFASSPDSTMVALYGQPSNYSDGWIANLNIEEVFETPPDEFELDQLYGINEILMAAKLGKDFSSSPALNTIAISDQQITVEIGSASEKHDQSSQLLAFFPHIPQTGGHALHDGFLKAFGQKKCLKIWNPRFGADIAPTLYPRINMQHFANISAVFGYLTMTQFSRNQYCHSLLNDDRVRIFTSVREPIDRIISLYNYIRLSPRHPNHASTMKMSLSEFALLVPANFQYHYLALNSLESIDSIQSRMEISPTGNARHGLDLFLLRHFHITLSGPEIENESQAPNKAKILQPSSIDNIDQGTIRHLKTIHHLDVELYTASLQSRNCP